MKILVSRPYLNELKVSVFLLFSVVGLIVILVGVSVYDLRTNPCLLKEIKKSAVDLVKPGGGKE